MKNNISTQIKGKSLMKKITILAVLFTALLQISGCAGRMSANTVNSGNDLQGKKIGVTIGSTATAYADGFGTLQTYESTGTMLNDVKNSVLDCAVMDEAIAKSAIKKVPGLKILSEPLIKANFCFAIAKENPDLLEAVNSALKDLSESGLLEKMIEGYGQGNDFRYKSPDDVDLSVGTLTLAVDAELPPYSYKDDQGQPVGLDIDIAHAVCDILHVEMIVTVVEKDVSVAKKNNLIITVQYGKADFSLGGITNNEEDAKLVVFSEPYTTCTQVIVVRQ